MAIQRVIHPESEKFFVFGLDYDEFMKSSFIVRTTDTVMREWNLDLRRN